MRSEKLCGASIIGTESDWKKFQSLIPDFREQFVAKQNAKLIKILSESNKSETERFWATWKRAKQVSKELQECLDGHSRSNMELYMRKMLRVGMLSHDMLVDFSDDLQARLKIEY